ncbi:hypothetical protein EYC80_003486 [Monilinia laxa]|uniref:Uncharacterized protein n=1 Tax=Monilinia laxa TaxID=61186 RepID=A0A5N6KE53_MONLA|nr:hypothetical protein EYC80_003486 [Monilinia laxa]
MTRNSKHPLGPSSLSNILFSYEEPLLETQPSTNVPLLPGSLVFERIVPKGTFKGAVENHDLVQVHFERLHRKNPVSSDTVGIRKVSNSIGNLSVTGQEIKPNSIPTSDNEISCSIASKMAKSDVEIRSSNEKSQDLAPSCNNCAPKADALGSFIHYLRELEDFLALDASLPMKSNLSQQSPDQNLLEGFSNENQESKTPVSHGNYFKESNDKIMDGKTSSGELVGHDVRKSSSQSSPNTESESQAMEREDLNDHSTNNPPHFLSPRHYNNIISSSFPLPCKDTTAQDDQDDQDSRGCLTQFCNYSPIDWSAENDGCPKKKFTLSRRATNEPLTDRAKGIMDADRPDSFKRLFSTIRVQNENPEKSDARKRRRREIIKDDISDCDLAGMGEPKKIVRLHRQELMNELNAEESIAKGGMREFMNKLKSEESITEERVKELMSIGRFKGYADILGTEITESETTKRVSLEVDGLNSDEMEIDEPSENSCTTKSKGKASEFLVSPELTRRQPMQFSGGVAMVRSGAESKKGTMKTLSQDLSVPDLRRLQQRVSEIREFITNKPSVSGDMGSSMLREMKRQLQQIRDQVVSTKPPATDDDRQRAARIIRQIEAENKVQNKSGNDSSIDLCGWYYHDEYETDTELLVVDMAIEEVSSEIRLIPKGDKRRKFKQARLDRLESRRALIEDKDIFYEDSSCDDLEFNEDDFLGKNEPDVPSKKYEQLNDEYRNAIASWGPEPTDATNEDPDLLHAIKLSLGQGEFVEAMNEGIDHAVPTPSNKTWKDGVESEKDQIEHAIELSLNQRQHFEPKKQGTGRAETLSWPGTWGNDVDSEEEQLKRVIAISLATARGEDLEDEDYYMR